jgi:hypothetical protein
MRSRIYPPLLRIQTASSLFVHGFHRHGQLDGKPIAVLLMSTAMINLTSYTLGLWFIGIQTSS